MPMTVVRRQMRGHRTLEHVLQHPCLLQRSLAPLLRIYSAVAFFLSGSGSFHMVESADSNHRPPACKIGPGCRIWPLIWGCARWRVRWDRALSDPVVVRFGGQRSPWVIVQVQHQMYLGHEVGVGGGLPGLGSLPTDTGVVQDLAEAPTCAGTRPFILQSLSDFAR